MENFPEVENAWETPPLLFLDPLVTLRACWEEKENTIVFFK